MWQTDARCPACSNKKDCKDREAIYAALSPLTSMLNTEAAHADGPGDGTLIIACQDFTPAPRN